MSNFRIMTAMLLFQFEQELGRFISQKSSSLSEISDLADTITKREAVKRPQLDISTTSQLIQETYLEDLFQIAIKMTEQSSDQANVLSLKKLCSALSLYEIRNAVCHPNRPFPEFYWYRMAAIASDPLVQKLEFSELGRTLESALLGKIQPPPDEWTTLPEWYVSNNLPTSNDFEITGLIGRPTESKELEKLLLNPRVTNIAIVAPGGVGKTALTLDVLDKICKTPEFQNIFDGVIFLSLKLEKLTANGIQKIDALGSINQIEEELIKTIPSVLGEEISLDNFAALKEKYACHKLLLFVDNLETLLRDNPTEFNEFELSLPSQWRVLVTSRITINSSTCLPISPLQDKNAKHLARLYAIRRNASGLINDDILDKIVSRTRCNPLAIRLSVDAYILGSHLDQSLENAARDVLSFSYKNLLEVISKPSRSTLECLFLQDPQSRIELAENLDSSIDNVATSLVELSRTSLILRNSQSREELYSLYPSIRDLLLISPLDSEVRVKVQNKIFQRAASISGNDNKQVNLSPFHSDYVDPELPQVVREACFDAIDITAKLHKKKTPSEALQVLERLRRLKSEYPKLVIIFRWIAKLHFKLGDAGTALSELSDALSIDPDNLRLLQETARLAHDSHKYDVALKHYTRTKEILNWNPENADESTVRNCLNGYLIALLYSARYKEMLDETINWDSQPNTKNIMGIARARAWKRSIEGNTVSLDKKIPALKKSVSILNEISKVYGYTRESLGSFREVIEEIADCVLLNGFAGHKDSIALISFSNIHVTNVFGESDDEIEKILEFAKRFRSVQLTNNPFKAPEWDEFLKSQGGKIYVDAELKDNLSNEEYIFVHVYHIPKQNSPFVFAQSIRGKQYFIHSEIVGHASKRNWHKIVEGTEIAIKAVSEPPLSGKAWAASEAHILL